MYVACAMMQCVIEFSVHVLYDTMSYRIFSDCINIDLIHEFRVNILVWNI